MGRLLLFQKSCLETRSNETHKVDGWMVKFLMEHSLPLVERMEPSQATSPWDQESPVIATFPSRARAVNNALAFLWET